MVSIFLKKDNSRIFILGVVAVFLLSVLYPICREISSRAKERELVSLKAIESLKVRENPAPIMEVSKTSDTKSLPKIQLTKNLKMGDSDPEVKLLQQYLNENGFVVATSGAGSPGHETNLFGASTKSALIKFQESYADIILKPSGLSHGTGILGKATRDFINS